jgi:DNA recombination protein RmuC
MQKLGSKAYWEQLDASPELVVMFLPGESFFQAALNEDVSLIEFGVEHKVFPASPITLIALLRAVEHGWREERIQKNAAEISALGAELYNRVARMTTYLEDLRRKLDGAVQTYNDLIGSYEGRVLVQARKFKDLGAASGDEIAVQEQIKTTTRIVQTQSLLELPDERNGRRN